MSDYKQTLDAAGKVTTQYDKMLRNLDDYLVKRARLAQFDTGAALYGDLSDRIEELEAKLAKAVEALKKLRRRQDCLETYDVIVDGIVEEALAELKGQGDE